MGQRTAVTSAASNVLLLQHFFWGLSIKGSSLGINYQVSDLLNGYTIDLNVSESDQKS